MTRRTILVSNRLPVTASVEDGVLTVERSVGGLATGLSGATRNSPTVWIGWAGPLAGISRRQVAELNARLTALDCVPVSLSSREIREMSKGGSALVEYTFPGFLAFVDGLLLKQVNSDSPAPANPRPEVVEDILLFLATRCLELLPETDRDIALEREMTARLIDLVLYRLHGIAVDGIDRFEIARLDGDE